jgi:hypothetical protein
MAYGKKSYGRSEKNDKYLRLTGLWPSKSNDSLFTGRVKADDVEAILEKFQEALDSEAPIVFSLWVNDKKKQRSDPEFSLQCFVGDSEEKPRSRRGRDEDEEDEKPRSKSSKRDEPEEDEPEDEDETPDEEDEEEEEDEKPRKKSSRTPKAPAKKAKSKNDW